MKKTALGLTVLAAAFTSTSAFGATLFSENFDVDPSASWTINPGIATDFTADFAFDYSTIGIPEAPNSTGTTATTGLKMYANAIFGAFGGGSVSPTGLDLGTGDYTLKFDWWQNFHGPAPGGGSGTTQISYGGVMTDGLTSNSAGASDSVFLAQTLDGGSSADWRVYSSDKPVSYAATDLTGATAVYEASLGGTDATARNASNPYYFDRVAVTGPLPGNAIPAAQTAAVALIDPLVDQTGTAQDGITAFSWAEGEVTKVGDIVTMSVNGLLIATVDTSTFTTATGGNNILLGHGDTNSGSSSDLLFTTLTFSLFDNVRVEDVAAGIVGDLNGDGFVGIDDLNIVLGAWNQNVPPANPLADPSGDGFVGIDDLNQVLGNWNAGTPPTGGAAVPEPTTLALLGLGGVAMLRRR